jgi:hypothetical protein
MTRILVKLWRGNYSLGKTYWLFGLLLPVPIAIAMVLVSLGLKSYFCSYLVYTLLTIYSFVQMVGTWRSAEAYTGLAIWRGLAKFSALASFVNLGAQLITMVIVPEMATRRIGLFPWIS